AAMHLNHFTRTLGLRFKLQDLTLGHLQDHVNQRARKRTKAGRALSPSTLRKEVSSLRAAWNWGASMGLVSGPFPGRGLRYPKGDEKPAFQTWAEIERQIARGGLSKPQQKELWDCLFLTLPEVTELLDFIKKTAAHPWIYPMACFAAHTGARRSEMLRVKLEHLDLEGGSVLVHEKKRDKTKRTTRRVPLSPLLVSVIKEYLSAHPGGQFLFCQGEEVFRSRTRSRTTGHKGEKTRASTLTGRLAGVMQRERPGLGPLTRDEAHDHLKRTLRGSKWEVLRGWHVFRHSFCSILAMKGCDQRVIDEFVGHQTEEQQRRYRHLAPAGNRQPTLSA